MVWFDRSRSLIRDVTCKTLALRRVGLIKVGHWSEMYPTDVQGSSFPVVMAKKEQAAVRKYAEVSVSYTRQVHPPRERMTFSLALASRKDQYIVLFTILPTCIFISQFRSLLWKFGYIALVPLHSLYHPFPFPWQQLQQRFQPPAFEISSLMSWC